VGGNRRPWYVQYATEQRQVRVLESCAATPIEATWNIFTLERGRLRTKEWKTRELNVQVGGDELTNNTDKPDRAIVTIKDK